MEDALDAAAMLVATGRAVPYPKWAEAAAESEDAAFEAAVWMTPPARPRR